MPLVLRSLQILRHLEERSEMSGIELTRLESERLIVRRFADSDLATFLAYRNDPEVARYQAWESCTEREATTIIEELKSLQPGTPGEWFQFAIELKETGALIGDCALKVEHDGPQAEVGYTLSREHQGKGYASEAVSCLLDYAFGDLGLHRVVAITDQENEPSVALLERLGIRREGHFVQNAWFKGRWASEYLYAVLADEWLRREPRA
jgi:RimJ/RimL family protein N-acetyltransferase